MSSLRLLFKRRLHAGLLALASVLAVAAMPSQAAESTEQSTAASSGYQVELQRNRDYACTQCHKENKDGMHGAHAKAISPNNGMPVTCTNCHGTISPAHRDGAVDAMRFNKDTFPVDKQNQVCMTCHQPEKLRAALWAHDVHILKTSCASCHQLHPAVDPVKGLDKKGQIKLCVDCHSEQQKLHQKEKETP